MTMQDSNSGGEWHYSTRQITQVTPTGRLLCKPWEKKENKKKNKKKNKKENETKHKCHTDFFRFKHTIFFYTRRTVVKYPVL